MFERRLKILLSIIFLLAAVMLARAVQLQIKQHGYWEKRAAETMKSVTTVETSRGRIFDRNGKLLAFDAACIDAAVDYRAIVLNDKWIESEALRRLPPKDEALPTGMTRKKLLADEKERVKADIDQMWKTIATVCNKSPEEIEHVKQDIQDRVTVLQRSAWWRSYNKSQGDKGGVETESSWKKWLIGESSTDNDDKLEASIDASSVDIGEQTQAHVIVADITPEQQVALQKAMSRCPGLVLKESSHRRYDEEAAKVAAHVLGHVSPVVAEDLKADPYIGKDDLRRYFPRDKIGRDGLERLAEPILRGAKGRSERVAGKKDPEEINPPVAGGDVRTTIDIDLQKEISTAFDQTIHIKDGDYKDEMSDLHGAAVVIDVPTGQVLAMVSRPTYDLNAFDAQFRDLVRDGVNQPLLNRATQQAEPPGSTCKTIIGSVAVTRGLLSTKEGIECTGYLKNPPGDPDTKRYYVKNFKCWTARLSPPVFHHSQPLPQKSKYGYPDGWLSLDDAIERSCNVFFETVAWRLKLQGVADALDTFGLGRPTGIGIAEASGMIPSTQRTRTKDVEWTTFMAGIGQGSVTATPLQMANVSATLARGGVWVRPRLLMNDADLAAARAAHPLPKRAFPEDRRDLHMAPDGQRAIRDGMILVVRDISGTGPSDNDSEGIREYFESIDLAGKTGSAQTSDNVLRVKERDENGQPIHLSEPANLPEKQRPYKEDVYPVGAFPWLKGVGKNHDVLVHAWFMGYAPAHDPKIAFCVLVEYGGSGGRAAGPIGRAILEACVRHGYLQAKPVVKSVAVTGELMHDEPSPQ